MDKKIPIEVSARHIHLSQKDLELLFGKGYQLNKRNELTQPDEFAAEESLSLKAGDKTIDNVRIVGPLREKTQVELSLTDAFYLKLNPPLRISGDTEKSEGITLIGPESELNLKEGVIIAKRHIHCSPKEAEELNLEDRMSVSVKTEGERSVIFNNVIVRIGDYNMSMHIDTDEANASGINRKGEGSILSK